MLRTTERNRDIAPGKWIQWDEESGLARTDKCVATEDLGVTVTSGILAWDTPGLRLAPGQEQDPERRRTARSGNGGRKERSGAEPAEYSSGNTAGPYRIVRRERVHPSALNPRKRFDEAEVEELAASIRANGILQPLVVRPRVVPGRRNGDTYRDQYELIAGERRWRAAAIAELDEVPVIVREDIDDVTALKWMFEENEKRASLNPIERAQALATLQAMGRKQAQIAADLGVGQPQVAKILSLLKLPEPVQEMIAGGRLSQTHGAVLAARFGLFPEAAIAIAEHAARTGAPARALEEGLPFQYDLDWHKMARRLGYGVTFDLSVCRKCPFSANVAGWCLKPEHFDELEAAARQERDEKLQAAVDEAQRPRGEEARPAVELRLKDLQFGAYECLRKDRPPACSTACECWATAIDRDGARVEVCLKPGRLNQLKGQQTREETKQRKGRFDALYAELEQRVTNVPWLLSRGLAVLLWEALRPMKIEAKRRAAQKLPDGKLKELLQQPAFHWGDEEAWQAVATAPVTVNDVLALAVLTLGADEFLEKLEYRNDRTRKVNWLLEREQTPPAPEPEGLPCPSCGESLTSDCPGVTVGLEPDGRARVVCEDCAHEGAT